MKHKQVTIYTDGACSGNPGPGGWAAILQYKSQIKELSGFDADTTNNRMEIMAAIAGLEILKESCEVRIYTDSSYLCNAFNNGWIKKWQQNNWKTSKKEAVENQDLWQCLVALTNTHAVNWYKVKGHSDNVMNNRCDKLARDAIKQMLPEPKHTDIQG